MGEIKVPGGPGEISAPATPGEPLSQLHHKNKVKIYTPPHIETPFHLKFSEQQQQFIQNTYTDYNTRTTDDALN